MDVTRRIRRAFEQYSIPSQGSLSKLDRETISDEMVREGLGEMFAQMEFPLELQIFPGKDAPRILGLKLRNVGGDASTLQATYTALCSSYISRFLFRFVHLYAMLCTDPFGEVLEPNSMSWVRSLNRGTC